MELEIAKTINSETLLFTWRYKFEIFITKHGFSVDDITDVFLSHLHFDCGEVLFGIKIDLVLKCI